MKAISISVLALITLPLVISFDQKTAALPIIYPYTRQFGTPLDDSGRGITIDTSGNIYVIGDTAGGLNGTNAGDVDFFINRYDPTGNQNLAVQFGTIAEDDANGIAVDGSGNIIVGGNTDGVLFSANIYRREGFVGKYSSKGALLWGKQIGVPIDCLVTCVTTDASGNVYVGGDVNGSLFSLNFDTEITDSSDCFIIKYDKLGNLIWNRQFGAAGEDDVSHISVNASGSIYAVGNTEQLFGPSTGDYDAYLAKFDGSGNLLWGKQFGGPYMDYATGLAVDSSGNCYLEGESSTDPSDGGTYNVYLNEFDSSGNQLWSNVLSSGAVDNANGIALDSSGNLLVSGDTTGNLFALNSGGVDVWLAKYTPSGAPVWTEQFGSTGDDSPSGICLDQNNVIYMAGDTTGNLFGVSQGGDDAFIARIGSNGQLSMAPTKSRYSQLHFALNSKPTNLIKQPILVAGKPFMYAGYLASGIPGAKVHANKQQIVIQSQFRQLVIGAKSASYSLDGKAQKMSAKPIQVADSLYVPLDVFKVITPYTVSYSTTSHTIAFVSKKAKVTAKG